MARSPSAHVNPDVLRWARESSGFALETAASRIGVRAEKLASAERGELLLTLRQAEKAADVYKRPLAALFLPAPPVEEPQEAQFRRLPGAPEPPWPSEMRVLARRVRQRQEAAAELHDVLDEVPAWPAASRALKVGRRALPAAVREALGISVEEQTSWRDPAGFTPLRHWVDAVEALGVLVMQDGSLPVDVMRGFASTHTSVPAIVVNTKDDPRARAFTVVHELGHLCLSLLGVEAQAQSEEWCNEFAGEVIMPREAIAKWSQAHGGDALDRIDEIALAFGVTPYAAAVRSARAGVLPQAQVDAALRRIRSRGDRRKGGGGNYYRTQLGRSGPAFVRLVFTALESQALTYPAASGLLDVKANHFGRLRTYLDQRAELD